MKYFISPLRHNNYRKEKQPPFREMKPCNVVTKKQRTSSPLLLPVENVFRSGRTKLFDAEKESLLKLRKGGAMSLIDQVPEVVPERQNIDFEKFCKEHLCLVFCGKDSVPIVEMTENHYVDMSDTRTAVDYDLNKISLVSRARS
mmetsp:Transcript_2099/g.3088  ORF Transcript_2099/g.3088 Transcript_2099/m.3088 type:complete len:144 (+) Transcript_2099:96-527(+)